MPLRTPVPNAAAALALHEIQPQRWHARVRDPRFRSRCPPRSPAFVKSEEVGDKKEEEEVLMSRVCMDDANEGVIKRVSHSRLFCNTCGKWKVGGQRSGAEMGPTRTPTRTE